MTSKFIMTVDYKAGHFPPFEHYELNAKNLAEAMNEAEEQREYENDVYMIFISEKQGNNFKGLFGEKCTNYTASICNRGNGWHTVDHKHSENPFMICTHKHTHSTEYEFISEF